METINYKHLFNVVEIEKPYTYVIKSLSGKTIAKIVLDVDGFYYIDFNVDNKNGYFNEYSLKCIAQVLEELNKDYNDKLNNYFNNKQ